MTTRRKKFQQLSKKTAKPKKQDKGFLVAITTYTLMLNVCATLLLTNISKPNTNKPEEVAQAQTATPKSEHLKKIDAIVVKAVEGPDNVNIMVELDHATPIGSYIERKYEGTDDDIQELQKLVAMEVTEMARAYEE